MKYEVLWSRRAEQELAALWLAAGDRDEITQAAWRIDKRLELDAHEVGESRAGTARIMFEPPLVALFHPAPQQQQVLVVHIWVKAKGKK